MQDWRFGFWLAVLVQIFTVVWTFQLARAIPWWWAPPETPPRDYFAPGRQRD